MLKGPDGPSWDTVYHRSNDLVLRTIAGENLLVPIAGDLARMEAVWVLSPVAVFIWEHLDGTRSMAAIRDEVLAEFDVGTEQAEEDLLGFVGELADAGLVTP